MTEHSMLTLLSILVTINIGLMSLLIGLFKMSKKEMLDMMKSICEVNEKEHNDMWDRVNHHYHNGGGNVVIPTVSTKVE
jgi:hypothetical protein